MPPPTVGGSGTLIALTREDSRLTKAKVESRQVTAAMHRTMRDAPLPGRTVSRATLTWTVYVS